MREFSMGVDDDAARCGHDPVDSLLGRLLKLPKGEGTNAGRGVPSGIHVWLAFVGGRMLPHESPDRFFSFVATRWAARARSRKVQ